MNTTHSTPHVPEFLKVLAHELRWNIVTTLAHSDRSVQEIIQDFHEPQNVVSYHLRKLREHHLVTERRSSADERSLYYSLDLEALRVLYLSAGSVLHPAIGSLEVPSDPQQWPIPERPLRVLFLCTHNSARSLLAEALLRQMSSGRVEVASAGTEPAGIHPATMQVLASLHVDHSRLRSKHIDELGDQHFDYVITVCDRVRESCPTWPDNTELIHWSFPDPVQAEGTPEQRYQAFEHTATQLATRIRYFLTLVEHRYQQQQPASVEHHRV
ncbi:arsenate reductase/protein-tyrosine-phosphatase family protein [Dictyobacter aurantiacus]|uniref:ArsR family transcriptional regulator n=1 Tax=Dictyobacter aurantiacus TaxID=1936993 RepID=A0A401ZLF4_9CHLR|nr:helix-turn-helix domain-containing protein [Dictyobacter aurantiacus]GCE07711.1 ArsR family transcriptional regulator [Dictyobacter aurantiacus]